MFKKSKIYNTSRLENNQANRKKAIIIILIIFIFLVGAFIGISYSKYESKLEGKVLANIAKPVIEIRKEQSLLLTALNPKASYVFEIRNFNENELNEVDMEYYIEIISNTNEAIKFELFKEGEQINLNNNKTEIISINKNEKQTHEYRLDIIYDNTKEEAGKNINENVEIKIHSIQKA